MEIAQVKPLRVLKFKPAAPQASVVRKVIQLARVRPRAAEQLEQLVDRLLEDQ
jgi:hypothetical protein